MRLLKCNNDCEFSLTEHFGDDIPPYAILSHTWGNGEVSFHEMQSGKGICSEKLGYDKIKRCCEVAAANGFEYVWIDTCCIDKTSSSELSEAINSMYKWYEEAETCYVYLADVYSNTDPQTLASAISNSRWFTRGWTLQELIAPSDIIFFDANWQDIGTKCSLSETISQTTGIHVAALSDANLEDFSVAQRMSWASKRKTTRAEDIAYCLMGIFAINMPMLYGEADRAFLRLQEEIMKKSNDHSIFAWKSPPFPHAQDGFLAQSPAAFADCGTIIRSTHNDTPPFTITNKGIHLQIPLKPLDASKASSSGTVSLAVLDCKDKGQPDDLLCILVRNKSEDRFTRVHNYGGSLASYNDQLATINSKERKELSKISIYMDEDKPRNSRSESQYWNFLIDKKGIEKEHAYIFEVYPRKWIQTDKKITSLRLFFGNLIGILGFMCKNNSEDRFFVALLEKKNTLAAIVDILRPTESLQDIFSSFVSLSSFPKNWNLATDRINWQHPRQPWCVSVAIKRRLISGQRRVIVHIDKHEEVTIFSEAIGFERRETLENRLKVVEKDVINIIGVYGS